MHIFLVHLVYKIINKRHLNGFLQFQYVLLLKVDWHVLEPIIYQSYLLTSNFFKD